MAFGFGRKNAQLVCDRIMRGIPLKRKSMNVQVVFPNDGDFYYVQHYSTIVAIGKKEEPPFACRTCGWNTKTTLGLLRSLGFDLESKVIPIGKPYKNPRTHRMTQCRDRILHIHGRPMLDESGEEADYESWWDKEGFCLGRSHFF
jgi:hypothetical protein